MIIGYHLWPLKLLKYNILMKFKNRIKLKFTSIAIIPTFRMLKSSMWLVTAALDRADTHFHPCRRTC